MSLLQPITPVLAGTLSSALKAAACTLPRALCTAFSRRAISALSVPAEAYKTPNADALKLLINPAADCDQLSANDENPLQRYRSEFPSSVWGTISTLGSKERFPTAVDISCSSGTSAEELAKRGFRVIAVQQDHLLAHARQAVNSEQVQLKLVGSDHVSLPSSCADLVTVMHGLHRLNPEAVLPEVHRILKKDSVLVAAFNDRDIHSHFVLDLEDLMETYNPDYVRSSAQHTPGVWTKTLTHGAAFELLSYTCHPHALHMRSSSSLVDLITSLKSMRAVLAASSARRKRFSCDLGLLAYQHFGHEPFELPLQSRLYILRKQAGSTQED